MGLADLISRLEREAQGRVDAIRREADDDVRAIEAETERAVAEVTAGRLERGRVERQPADQRALAQARQQARARELEARYAEIARILARSRTLIPDVARSELYAAALPRHVDEALSFLDGLRPRVRCHTGFAPIVQTTIRSHPGASLLTDDRLGPGIVAEAADGSVSVDNTLAARLDRARLRLTIELGRKLDDGRE
jgi:vacuolar-type H+-ATPase subunit E/Vma4